MSCRLTSMLPRHGSGIARRSSSSRPAWPNRSETGHGCPKAIKDAWMRVLQRRAVTDQMQAKTRELALAADARVRQPDLRDEIARRQRGQHARVDLVGLARQRRQALD